MTTHEIRTDLPPAEILDRAHAFFMLAGTPYAAFPSGRGEGWLRLHMDVGEVVIAAMRQEAATVVRGSSSRGAHLLTRFLRTLAAPCRAMRRIDRYGRHETHSGRTVEFAAARGNDDATLAA